MELSGRLEFRARRNQIETVLREKKVSGESVFNLSQSNPTRTGLIHESGRLARALASEANALYDPDPKGLISARDAIVRNSQNRDRLSVDRTVLCASTSEAYSHVFKLLCNPGDAVLVPRPGYPLFDHLAALEAVHPVPYRLEYEHPHGWSIDMDSIRKVLESPSGTKVKAIVLINPNNPTGSYVGTMEVDAIVDLCMRHSIAIIADEVFLGYTLDDKAVPHSLAGEDRVLTFTLDGFSKRLCLPQIKLAWIHVSGPQCDEAMEALELISDTYLSAGAPAMNAAPALFALEPSMNERVRTRMRQVMGVYSSVLCKEGSPHRILTCQGGWTALVQSPRFLTEEEIALGLLRESGLHLHPGYFFDMESEAFFAFSLIIEPESALAAAEKYLAYFDKLA